MYTRKFALKARKSQKRRKSAKKCGNTEKNGKTTKFPKIPPKHNKIAPKGRKCHENEKLRKIPKKKVKIAKFRKNPFNTPQNQKNITYPTSPLDEKERNHLL